MAKKGKEKEDKKSAKGKEKSVKSAVPEDEKPKSPMPKQHQPRPGIEAKMTPRPEYKAEIYKGSGKLQDKAAIVTGGDSGIGRAVAVLYAREGADVAIIYLKAEQKDAEETARQIEKEGGKSLLIAGDVTDEKFCGKAVEKVVKEFGKLDVLVNNAAFQKHQNSIDEISLDDWDKHFKTNIYGYFYLVRHALGHLKEGSAIINTGSITGLEGNKDLLAYSSTKGAIHAFTKSLAQILVEKKIRVNCVAPGPIWTPLNVADKPAKEVAEHGADTPMKRPGQPEEVAPAYVFFASNADSSYITGEVMTLLGGDTRAA